MERSCSGKSGEQLCCGSGLVWDGESARPLSPGSAVCSGVIPGRSARPLPAKPTAALPGGYQRAQIG